MLFLPQLEEKLRHKDVLVTCLRLCNGQVAKLEFTPYVYMAA